jgi:predicted glycoside hydrolase/deacetylase ChbG (UPF0249 family)
MLPHRHRVLCADDYAMTSGVSRAIESLAATRKISATSAMVTMPQWRADAPRIRELRTHVAIGLHLNFTLGSPAGPAPTLASNGGFGELQPLIGKALARRLDPLEVREEIGRQLDLFEQVLGFPPDHVDGHQHVQVLPVIRGALLAELEARYRERPPLLRNPSESVRQIARSSPAKGKALTVKALSANFRHAARQLGLPVNASFSGFSAFDTERPFETEMITALDRHGDTSPLKIVMCHPGFPDAELAAIDPVVARRRQEYDVLMKLGPPEAVIWHPQEDAAGIARPVPDWKATARGELG